MMIYDTGPHIYKKINIGCGQVLSYIDCLPPHISVVEIHNTIFSDAAFICHLESC
jgi:hypothetical protein